MADHSHLFFFNNLSPNPKPSHARPFTTHLRRSNTTSDGGSQARTSFSPESQARTRSQPKHLPLSLIFRNLKELKLPSSFKANPSHHHLSTSLLDLSEPNSQTHSSIYHSGVEALHNQTRARCRKSLTDLVADLVIPWVLGCCLALKFSLYFYYT